MGDKACRHRASGHAVKMSSLGGLYEDNAAIGDDVFQSQRAITSGARENDGNGTLAPILPQGAKYLISGWAGPAGFGGRCEADVPPLNSDFSNRGGRGDAVRFQEHAIL